jgi:hypothetical protein
LKSEALFSRKNLTSRFGLETDASLRFPERANATPESAIGATAAAAKNPRRVHIVGLFQFAFIVFLLCVLCELCVKNLLTQKTRESYFTVQSSFGIFPPSLVRKCSFMIKNAPMP